MNTQTRQRGRNEPSERLAGLEIQKGTGDGGQGVESGDLGGDPESTSLGSSILDSRDGGSGVYGMIRAVGGSFFWSRLMF